MFSTDGLMLQTEKSYIGPKWCPVVTTVDWDPKLYKIKHKVRHGQWSSLSARLRLKCLVKVQSYIPEATAAGKGKTSMWVSVKHYGLKSYIWPVLTLNEGVTVWRVDDGHWLYATYHSNEHIREMASNYGKSAGLILGLLPANERRRCFVTTSLISWAQA